MKKALPFLVIIASIVVILATIYAFVRKPKIVFDANGFPLNPKEGDTFTKDGKIYTFTSGVWLVELGPPSGGPSGDAGQRSAVKCCVKRDASCKCTEYKYIASGDKCEDPGCGSSKGANCPDWTNGSTTTIIPSGIVPLRVVFKTKNKCEPCIKFRGAIYTLVSSQNFGVFRLCEYKKQ